MTNQWRKKCPEGCTCGKHRSNPCKPGCMCSRHDAPHKRRKCPEGCTCGRHTRPSCKPGCKCIQHRPPHNKYTPEQKAEAEERRRARGREYMRQRRAADPERARREAREQYLKNGRKHNLKWKFGITPDQLSALIASQDGRCYLCREPLDGVRHIDHDRSCCPGNKSCGSCIRGVAHQKCNQGIGQFGDDPQRMRMIADNLEAAQARLEWQRADN